MLESLHRSDSDREALEWVGFRLRNVKLQSKVCLAVLDRNRQGLQAGLHASTEFFNNLLRIAFDRETKAQGNPVLETEIAAEHCQLQNAMIVETCLPQLIDILLIRGGWFSRQPTSVAEEHSL